MLFGKKQKIVELAVVVLGLAFFTALVLVALDQNKELVRAQIDETWKCSFITPVGTPLQKSSELINEVYKEYNQAANYLNAAIESTRGALTALSQNKDVCDFTECYAETNDATNISPDFVLGVTSNLGIGLPSFLSFEFRALEVRAPLCAASDCLGDPCSLDVFSASLKELKNLQRAFQQSYTNISDLFTKKTEKITYDLTEKEKEIGQAITKKEAVERNIEWAEDELNFCALTEREQALVKDGKLGDRKLMRCVDALQEGVYMRPKIWSEKCAQECASGADEECLVCLQKCEGTSFLAQMNCKMFQTKDNPACLPNGKCCGAYCSQGFTQECTSCFCEGLSERECLELVCAGSRDNFMCCHQGSLER